MTDTTTTRLAALLESERTALLEGDFDRIADLMEEKSALLAELEGKPLDAEEVAPLRDGLRLIAGGLEGTFQLELFTHGL